jgi:hypothetical protein
MAGMTLQATWLSPQTRTGSPYTYTGTWLWNSQPLPPLTDELRTDSRDWPNALILGLWNQTVYGRDAGELIMYLVTGNVVQIQQTNNNKNWAQYTLTGPAVQQADTSWQVPGSRTAGSGQASNGQATTVSFTVLVPNPPGLAYASCSICGAVGAHVRQESINAGTHSLYDPCANSADAVHQPGTITPSPMPHQLKPAASTTCTATGPSTALGLATTQDASRRLRTTTHLSS